MKRIFLVAALVVSAAPPTSAQTWRTFDAARQIRDSQPLAVHLRYAAGRVRVLPSTDDRLFGVHMRFDAQSVEPIYQYNAVSHTLEVGVDHTISRRKFRDGDGSDLQLHLTRSVPMRLQLDVGAAEGDIDLTGLQLDELSVQTGAAATRVRFDSPNSRRMRAVTLQAGAAEVRVTGLANANTQRVDLNLGVGNADLDFGGEWKGDLDMSINTALGKVTLRVPSDVGVSIESSSFLHSTGGADMVKRDGRSVSANWDTAKYKLRVVSSGAFGRLEVARVAR
jgi:hypothetical protein